MEVHRFDEFAWTLTKPVSRRRVLTARGILTGSVRRRFPLGHVSSPWRILFANEPRIYRQVLSRVLQKLRPQIKVLTVEPDELDHATLRLTPDLVVCSLLTTIVETRSPAWILLYPEWTGIALVSVNGNRRVVDNIDFPLFLAIVDQIADLLARSA